MKKIIFCNSLSIAKEILHKESRGWSYLTIGHNKNSLLIKKFIKDKRSYAEISLSYFNGWKEEYLMKFVSYLGKINLANSKNSLWWALNFTNKNPILTPLCNKVFYSLFIAKIIKEDVTENLLVISEDYEIAKQLKIWFKNTDVKVVCKIKFTFSKNNLKTLVCKYAPLAVFFAALRVLMQKLCLRTVRIDKNKNYTVTLSLLNHQSFKQDGSYEDTYFGELTDYILNRGLSVINFLYVNTPEYKKMVETIHQINSKFIMLTLEYFLSTIDVIRCFFVALYKYNSPISLKGHFDIDGRDTSYLVQRAIRCDYEASCFFDNLRNYYSVKNLSKVVRIGKFYYPFENRSFEKMIILALRKFSPETRIMGYQHAALSLQHTNFLLTKGEAGTIPLPDKIITIGEVTRNFMRDLGNFPNIILESGCALRQKKYSTPLKSRRLITNLLVVLATNLEEYTQVIIFLNSALANENRYKIWIRPHPRLPLLDEAIEISGAPHFSFHRSDKETLQECLQWSDVVLNICSTVAIEALARGIPVVHLNISNILNPDPVINFNDFRWQAKKPEVLQSIINEINELSEVDFLKRQKKGVDYANRYLYPVNEKNLEVFIKA